MIAPSFAKHGSREFIAELGAPPVLIRVETGNRVTLVPHGTFAEHVITAPDADFAWLATLEPESVDIDLRLMTCVNSATVAWLLRLALTLPKASLGIYASRQIIGQLRLLRLQQLFSLSDRVAIG
jgi:hypothetical protein